MELVKTKAIDKDNAFTYAQDTILRALACIDNLNADVVQGFLAGCFSALTTMMVNAGISEEDAISAMREAMRMSTENKLSTPSAL